MPGPFRPTKPLTRVHLIGICGAGMQPIARALMAEGIAVAGSDQDLSKGRELREAGATLFEGHAAENLGAADAVVFSTAISESNPEIAKARAVGIPIVHRSEMLGWLLGRMESVLIAGTHGKTTTTTLTSLLLTADGKDPWSFVGGYVREFGGNLRIGKSRIAVAEADESDGSFLNLPRQHAIITNIEAEHLNHWGTEAAMFGGFEQLLAPIPHTGAVVLCADDAGIQRLLPRLTRPVVTYGMMGPAEFSAVDVVLTGTGSEFTLRHHQAEIGRVRIGVPGKQNVANATGAFALATMLGVDPARVLNALAEFRGVDRRFTKLPGPNGSLIIDDYAHHPTEIAATMAAARMAADERGGKLRAIFQPHRITRTESFFNDFGPALASADEVFLTDIYAAGEPPIAGITGATLAAKITSQIVAKTHFMEDFGALKKAVLSVTNESDIVLILGAGSVTKLAHELSRHAAPSSIPPRS